MGRANKSRIKFKALDEWMKALDRKISIKVGIIGKEAEKKHPDSGLTNAELGAIHEFGATIKTTKAMRGWFYRQGVQKSNNPVVIPTRSFLRASLMSSEGKKELRKVIADNISGELKATDFSEKAANKILDDTIHLFAETALLRVLNAFESGGFGKWAPITEFTAQRRYNASNPPLTDTGDLRQSISYEIKETK